MSGELERMERLARTVTFGSAIPLLTFAHDDVIPVNGLRLAPTDHYRHAVMADHFV